MTLLGLVPARSGSKGLPDKNIKLLLGKPLLAWTVQAALNSGVPMELVLSTDSEKYADIGLKWGAKVPFLRPEALATDSASSLDVLWHMLDWYSSRGKEFDAICFLQPTSPLRQANDISLAWQMFLERDANAVVSVCEMEHSPLWSNTLDKDLSLENFLREEVKGKRRQDLPSYFRLNGAIYIAKVDFLRSRGSFYGPGSFAYVMPQSRSIDIDSELDFDLAEILCKRQSDDQH